MHMIRLCLNQIYERSEENEAGDGGNPTLHCSNVDINFGQFEIRPITHIAFSVSRCKVLKRTWFWHVFACTMLWAFRQAKGLKLWHPTYAVRVRFPVCAIKMINYVITGSNRSLGVGGGGSARASPYRKDHKKHIICVSARALWYVCCCYCCCC